LVAERAGASDIDQIGQRFGIRLGGNAPDQGGDGAQYSSEKILLLSSIEVFQDLSEEEMETLDRTTG
jgi:hypothetical protein